MNLDEAISAASEKLSAEAPEEIEAPAVEAPAPEAEAAPAPEAKVDTRTAAERARDEKGRFAQKTEKAPEKSAAAPRGGANGAASVAPAAVQGKGEGAVAPPVAPTPAPVPQVRAPQSWTPSERESWAKVPAEAQAAIARREREMAVALQETAPVRQFATQVQQALTPYESIARANGMDAMTFAGSALQNIAAIYSGAPQQAVSVVAGAVQMLQQRFGPQALDMINAAMEGRAVPQGQPQAPPRDPRVDQLFQQIEQVKAQRLQSEIQSAEEFLSSKDFGQDVRLHVADILDVWAKQGKTHVTQHDLERAYDLACQMDEGVAKALEQKKAAQALRTPQPVTGATRAAASSVRSSPAAAPAAQPKGIDGAMARAREKLGL